MDRFVNLEAESGYSLFHGTFRPLELVRAAKGLGQKAVGLTDRWGIYGVDEFVRCAKKEGIHPLVGARVMVEDSSWLSLYPRDLEGFWNLNHLISLGLTRNGRMYVTFKELKGHGKGLLAILSHGEAGSIRWLAERGETQGVRRGLEALLDAFGPGLFWGLFETCFKDRRANKVLRQEAASLGIRPVLSRPVVYLRCEDAWVHRLVVKIGTRYHRLSLHPVEGDGFHMLTRKEALMQVNDPVAADNTLVVLEELKGFSLPRAQYGSVESGNDTALLFEEALKQLARGFKPVSHAYIMRLSKEMEMVSRRGIASVFLLARRIREYAASKGISSSVRGSAAGSLLVHLLLGGPDPIRHGLLFERFMNKGRCDLPDIDMDFDAERRDEVTRWLMEEEPDSTALVSTVHTLRVRGAVRLAARAMDYPLDEIERLTRCLPWSLRGIDLVTALSTLPELRHSPLRSDPLLIRAADRIQGLPFKFSIHLGGVIVAPDHILHWSPLNISRKGFRVTQLTKDAVDAMGLLKLDILGLRMHTALRKAKEAVSRLRGLHLDLSSVPIEDGKAFELLQSSETLGVFQLESPGQRNLVARLSPVSFEDLAVEISLFRPGPVKGEMVDTYLRRRDGREDVCYPHPILRPILKDTYGVVVFQEQVLEIVHRFAGFTYDDADAFRRAMTRHRSSHEMMRLKEAFMEGARRLGRAKKTAEEVFSMVASFAAYGFCKAHAVSFAYITARSAFLKAHYPREFYLGLLNAGCVGSYPPWVIVNEARRMGIPILGPDVNRSGMEYTGEGEGIRLPLHVIHGIGPRTSESIVRERLRHGPFLSWDEFKQRVPLSTSILNTLYAAGALFTLKKAA